ncbi:hypothetical protein DIZ27_38920 [Streptomyces sp. NWU339]|uniref:hypothetical protein n=1 Tax=Streptomyces sp. NWU339 TaxID=2185284 RepID=UPI000D68230D|nr:hypothetical protein [Streptomyces sp. NWU339]PWI05508.1 hypothetical protein DIZ27_38920 [Streptomyces sp. NWU339]
MGAFGRIRDALGGGPSYTPSPTPQMSSGERAKVEKRRAREAQQAADRRRRHRAAVVRHGDAAGIPFDSEQKRRFGWRR